jgi:carbonic anhydrase
MNAQGATAVIGVFFRIGRKPNRVLNDILLAAPATAGNEVSAGEASPAELLRTSGESTIRGDLSWWTRSTPTPGSLTTPGCTEGVLWSVLADGGGVSERAVTASTG